MGFCSPVCKILRRAKYVVLLLISLSVLVWIRTFSGEVVKSFQVSYATTQTLVKGDSLKDKLNLWTVAPDHKHTQPPKAKCPQQSPLLRKYTLVEVKEVTNLLSRFNWVYDLGSLPIFSVLFFFICSPPFLWKLDSVDESMQSSKVNCYVINQTWFYASH